MNLNYLSGRIFCLPTGKTTFLFFCFNFPLIVKEIKDTKYVFLPTATSSKIVYDLDLFKGI